MIKSKVIFISIVFVLLFSVGNSLALESTDTEKQANFCIDDGALNERRAALREKEIKRLSKFRSGVIPKRSILIDVSELAQPLLKKGALTMNLSSVRAKTYLENEKLVLVGDGFNDEALMAKAAELEFAGFMDIKVLGNGRRSSLLNNSNVKRISPSKNQLHFVNANIALSNASSSSLEQEYSFILLGEGIPQLSDYGLSYSVLPFNKTEEFTSELEMLVDGIIAKKRFAKIIFVLNETDQKQYLLSNKKLSELENVWMLQGEEIALKNAISSSKILPVRARSHRLSCNKR